jgi:multiple sugar transport system ATP-binding protein
MRTELKKLQAELNQTIIFSTHDQLEALSIADRILLLHNGKMQQCDVPEEMYKRPINKYVANFIGSPTMNFIDCTLVTEGNKAYFDSGAFHINATEFKETMEKHASASEFILGVRPEHVYVGDRNQSKEAFQAKVELTEPLGNMTIIHFTVDNIHIKALIPSGNVPEIGRKIWVNFDSKKIYIYNRKTERNIISLSKEK